MTEVSASQTNKKRRARVVAPYGCLLHTQEHRTPKKSDNSYKNELLRNILLYAIPYGILQSEKQILFRAAYHI